MAEMDAAVVKETEVIGTAMLEHIGHRAENPLRTVSRFHAEESGDSAH
jgi:hypothetical protein